ncbi:hypothetical protein [Planomonospora algeriensis]
MRDEFSTHEVWSLECQCCGRVWQEEYTVRHVADERGHEAVVWTQAGEPVQPPWSGVDCPGCGASKVSAFPQGGTPADGRGPGGRGRRPPARGGAVLTRPAQAARPALLTAFRPPEGAELGVVPAAAGGSAGTAPQHAAPAGRGGPVGATP